MHTFAIAGLALLAIPAYVLAGCVVGAMLKLSLPLASKPAEQEETVSTGTLVRPVESSAQDTEQQLRRLGQSISGYAPPAPIVTEPAIAEATVEVEALHR